MFTKIAFSNNSNVGIAPIGIIVLHTHTHTLSHTQFPFGFLLFYGTKSQSNGIFSNGALQNGREKRTKTIQSHSIESWTPNGFWLNVCHRNGYKFDRMSFCLCVITLPSPPLTPSFLLVQSTFILDEIVAIDIYRAAHPKHLAIINSFSGRVWECTSKSSWISFFWLFSEVNIPIMGLINEYTQHLPGHSTFHFNSFCHLIIKIGSWTWQTLKSTIPSFHLILPCPHTHTLTHISLSHTFFFLLLFFFCLAAWMACSVVAIQWSCLPKWYHVFKDQETSLTHSNRLSQTHTHTHVLFILALTIDINRILLLVLTPKLQLS